MLFRPFYFLIPALLFLSHCATNAPTPMATSATGTAGTVLLPDSLRVSYTDEGQGPVLLFVHGLGSNRLAWRKTIAGLKDQFRCIALDLPGYGASPGGALPYDMSFYAGVVRDFIAAFELGEVTLVGHSMGGQIALHVALKDSRQLQRLVLIAPAGFETFTAEQRAWFRSLVTAEATLATPEEQIVRNFEINFHAMPDDARFMIDDRLALRQDTAAYRAYAEMIPLNIMGMLEAPVFSRLSQIQLPTLVFYGESDQLIPNRFLHPELTTEAVARAGVDQLPNAELVLLPRCGHFVQWECAAAVNAAIRAFVAGG